MQHDSGFGLSTSEVKRRHILPKALVVGLVAGLLASAFRVALLTAGQARISLLLRLPMPERIAVGLGLGIFGGAIGLWLVRRFAPDAGGSGIPQLKGFVLGERRMEWRWLLPVKFLAGLVGMGGGLALGGEGPTVQMGGATGLMVSEWFRIKVGEGERKALVAAGAGAGLAAAFNAPLTGEMPVFQLHNMEAPNVHALQAALLLGVVSAASFSIAAY